MRNITKDEVLAMRAGIELDALYWQIVRNWKPWPNSILMGQPLGENGPHEYRPISSTLSASRDLWDVNDEWHPIIQIDREEIKCFVYVLNSCLKNVFVYEYFNSNAAKAVQTAMCKCRIISCL